MILAPGVREPVGQTAVQVVPSMPDGIAWIDDRLLVWADGRLVLIDGAGGKPVWTTDVASLGSAQPASGGTDIVDAPGSGEVETASRRTVVRGGTVVTRGVVRGQLNLVQQRQLQVGGEQAVGDENIVRAWPAGDRVIAQTSSGRVFAVSLADGSLAWQAAAPDDSIIDRVEVSDEFTVARVQGAELSFLVFDNFSGNVLSRWRFTASPRLPVNFALGSDGLLVWLLSDRVIGKDLYEPGERVTFESASLGQPIFAGSDLPQSLVVGRGLVLALSNNGANIRAFNDMGEPLRSVADGADGNQQMVEAPLTTRAGDGVSVRRGGEPGRPVELRLVGSRLYAVSARTIISYDLERPADDVWTDDGDSIDDAVISQSIIGRDYVALIRQAGPKEPRKVEVSAFSRAIVPGRGTESGLLVHQFNIEAPSGIVAVQGVEGGIYYLTRDRELLFMRGTAESTEN